MLKEVSSKKAQNSGILQFLPLELKSIAEQEFLNFKNQKLKTAYVIDIVHNLLLRYFFRKVNEFCLSSVVLKSNYGKYYNYYIDYLIDQDILILKKNYSVGNKSRIYYLAERIIDSEISRHNNRDKILSNKRKKKASLNHNNKINSVLKLRLIDNLNYVELNYDVAYSFLMSIISDKDTLNRNLYAIDSIKSKYIFWHFDDYGRFHSNFTILKSFIRKNCLLLDNEQVKEIDIPNSQPLFLLNTIERSTITCKKAELEFFKQLVINGELYNHLVASTKNKSREEVKTMVYHVLFGRNNKSAADTLFKKCFPSIYNFIVEYKKHKGDYKSLSYELQIAESNFIFNNVLIEFSSRNPDTKFLTVHDSIIVPKSKYSECKEIFDDCYYKTFIA